ncbi:MAG: FRG domain-containing protein [Planctomycetaceae bacterium]|nr:FRG domain-containing protein [Planctomycetaceae bacterium]
MDCPRISNWGDLSQLLDDFSGSWLFRGAPREYGTLPPSLLREVDEGLSHYKISEIESYGLLHFSRASHLQPRGSDPPELRTTELQALTFGERIEWSTWLQHYGAPSRLLDWTSSPFVAAYFAVSDAVEVDAELWCVSLSDLRHRAASLLIAPDGASNTLDIADQKSAAEAVESSVLGRTLRHISSSAAHRLPQFPSQGSWFDVLAKTAFSGSSEQVLSIVDQLAQCDINELVEQVGTPIVFPVTTSRPTDRMLAQQGWFTVALDPRTDHTKISEMDVELKRYVISANSKPEIMRKLHSTNVSAHSLFPGLDGLGRAVRERLRHGMPW